MKMAAFYKVKKDGLVQSALGFPQLLKLIRSFVQSQNNFKGINEFWWIFMSEHNTHLPD